MPDPDLSGGSPPDAAEETELRFRGVRISLDEFEGPLDLLLHLIQEEEIEITEIPISRITAQYLETLEAMQELDLEIAGEYLVMAATLIRIKSSMLLPSPPVDEDGEEVDLRGDLIRRLIEYRKYKTLAEYLKTLESYRQSRHARQVLPPELRPDEIPLGKVNVFDLVTCLKRIVDRFVEEHPHEVDLEPVHLEDRIELLRERVLESGTVMFSEYIADMRSRMGVIVSFMAMLEMMKLGEVEARQDDTFADILIRRRNPGGPDPDA